MHSEPELREAMQRLLKPLSPSWVAEKVGVTRQQVDRWKNGYYVTPERLEQVAAAVGELLPGQPDFVATRRSGERVVAAAKPFREEPDWAQAMVELKGLEGRLDDLDRKLDLLLARSGIDPVDAEDEEEARRLLEKARARLAQAEPAGAEQ